MFQGGSALAYIPLKMDEMDGGLAKPRTVVDSDGSLGSEFE